MLLITVFEDNQQTLSEEIFRRHNVVLLSEDSLKITIVVDEGFNRDKQESLELLLGKTIVPVIANKKFIKESIEKQYSQEEEIHFNNRSLEIIEASSNIEDIVCEIINAGIGNGASDIHWERQKDSNLQIRYRIDGQLSPRDLSHLSLPGNKIIAHLKIRSHMNIDEKRLPQDGRMAWNYGGKKYDLRISSLPTVYGENLVIRILDREDLNLDIKALGFNIQDWEIVEKLLKKPNGLVLVTGPTGSGKTTTLYSALNYRSQFNDKIITVEDPIEYEFSHFAQIPVRTQIGMTFGNALRAILRQSPNTIMIGEIRDKETAQIAINAALTGHLVLATLHTNDALSAIYRLMDLGLEGYQIAAALQGIIGQRLVRKLCSFCKEVCRPKMEELSLLDFIDHGKDGSIFYRKRGCEKCHYTGFKGRLGLFEVLPMSEKLRDLVSVTIKPEDLKIYIREAGIKSIKEHGREKILEGLTTIEEVMAIVYFD